MVLRARARRLSARPSASVAEQRRAFASLPQLPLLQRGTSVKRIEVKGLPALRIESSRKATRGHLLYLHGGAYCMGSASSYQSFVARFARMCRLSATVLDYRLAPEHPYPACLDDCLQAYVALAAETANTPIVLAGDSAGGGAALATLLRIRDFGLPRPQCAVLLSPWVDLTGSSASFSDRADRDPTLLPRDLLNFASAYAGDVPTTNPELSPLFAPLQDLPPLLVQVGTEEILFDDSARLSELVWASGGNLELEVAQGMWHVFQKATPILPEARAAIASASSFIDRHLGK
jgi:epsilon-lactone hydrolase